MNGKPPERQPTRRSLKPEDDPNEWMRFADEDLRAATVLLGDETVPSRIVCFQCQQAAEKTLKAALLSNGRTPPKIHGLTELRARLPDDERRYFDPEELDRLEVWAVVNRYPGDLPDATPEQAGELVDMARRVVDAGQRIVRVDEQRPRAAQT